MGIKAQPGGYSPTHAMFTHLFAALEEASRLQMDVEPVIIAIRHMMSERYGSSAVAVMQQITHLPNGPIGMTGEKLEKMVNAYVKMHGTRDR